MAFICRINPAPAVLARVPEAYRRSASERFIFHTLRHRRLIKELWYRSPADGPPPLLHFWRDEPVIWTLGRGVTISRAWAGKPAVRILRPYVKRYPGKAKGDQKARHDLDRARHEWVQCELYNLGVKMGQNPKLEEVFDGCRIDVVWRAAGIAWEVDLTLPTSREQWNRTRTRREGGIRSHLRRRLPARQALTHGVPDGENLQPAGNVHETG